MGEGRLIQSKPQHAWERGGGGGQLTPQWEVARGLSYPQGLGGGGGPLPFSLPLAPHLPFPYSLPPHLPSLLPTARYKP